MDPARARWLQAHPFLIPMAKFQELLEGAAAAVPSPAVALPAFDDHAEAFTAGVALLRGGSHGPALQAAGAAALRDLCGRTANLQVPKPIADGLEEVRAAVTPPGGAEAAVAWLVAGDPAAPGPVQPGLVRFLGWLALGRVLAPVAEPFRAWRKEDAWRRPTCPTCGALPVMARLVDHAAGRERQLCCGCCSTRWSFKRIGCPYCGNEAAERLAVLELEGPAGLQLDVCESCKGYLKTYTGKGEEALFLSDWPTLVLDAMAAERGYQRRGASLYEL
jgi:FdhE protein